MTCDRLMQTDFDLFSLFVRFRLKSMNADVVVSSAAAKAHVF